MWKHKKLLLTLIFKFNGYKNNICEESFNKFEDSFYEAKVKNTINRLLLINDNLNIEVKLERDLKDIELNCSGLHYQIDIKEYFFINNSKNIIFLECHKSTHNDYYSIKTRSISE